MTHLAALPDAVSAGEQITIARLRPFNQGQSFGGSHRLTSGAAAYLATLAG